jgi:hypothetical protein
MELTALLLLQLAVSRSAQLVSRRREPQELSPNVIKI